MTPYLSQQQRRLVRRGGSQSEREGMKPTWKTAVGVGDKGVAGLGALVVP